MPKLNDLNQQWLTVFHDGRFSWCSAWLIFCSTVYRVRLFWLNQLGSQLRLECLLSPMRALTIGPGMDFLSAWCPVPGWRGRSWQFSENLNSAISKQSLSFILLNTKLAQTSPVDLSGKGKYWNGSDYQLPCYKTFCYRRKCKKTLLF